MQSEQYRAVREAAMKLSVDDRMFLADLLYMSVEHGSQGKIAAMFEGETDGRIENLEKGEAILVDGLPIIQELNEGEIP